MAKEASRRIVGLPLEVAARLMETPGPRGLLVRMAEPQLGLDTLRELDVPSA